MQWRPPRVLPNNNTKCWVALRGVDRTTTSYKPTVTKATFMDCKWVVDDKHDTGAIILNPDMVQYWLPREVYPPLPSDMETIIDYDGTRYDVELEQLQLICDKCPISKLRKGWLNGSELWL